MQTEALGGRLENIELAIGREWRHRQRMFSRTFERSAGVVAGNADLVFGFFVERFEIVVGDGPVFE